MLYVYIVDGNTSETLALSLCLWFPYHRQSLSSLSQVSGQNDFNFTWLQIQQGIFCLIRTHRTNYCHQNLVTNNIILGLQSKSMA